SKRLAIAGDFTGESTRPVNRQRGIDEATLPERYSACNTTERPDAAWAAQSKRKGPMRRGPPRCNCGSLTGDSGGAGRRPRLMYGPGKTRSSEALVVPIGSLRLLRPGADGNHPAAEGVWTAGSGPPVSFRWWRGPPSRSR